MERCKFWLIQRGKFEKLDAPEFLGGGSDHLINPDYMGSAEFEWGAIPKAFRRIMNNYPKYSMHVTDLKTTGGVPFVLFCRDDCYVQILEEIKRYIEKPYHLKEWTNLEYHFEPRKDSYTERELSDRKYRLQTNFWWCIDKVTQYDIDFDKFTIGDWIGFIGATDRQKAMQRVLDNTFNDWWMPKPPEEKSDLLKDIYR